MAPSRSLSYTAAVCGGIAVTSLAVRLFRRRQTKAREERVAKQGGLLPGVSNVMEALEWRSTHHSKDNIALESADGTTTYTWADYYEQVQLFARALLVVGESSINKSDQQQQEGVAVHAFNEPRWFFAAMGALAAGWTISGIYLTNSYHQASHVIKTSQVRVLVLESRKLLDSTYKTVLKDFPKLTVVLLEGGEEGPRSRTPSYEAFLKRGQTSSESAVTRPPKELQGGTVASLVYTSGTTGSPKATELTHTCIHSVCAMMHARIPLSNNDIVVSYLPLSHIAAMGIDLFSPIYCGAKVCFADSNALQGSLKDTLLRVRPTLFFGVPRVWEKMTAAMQEAAAKSYSKKGSGKVLKAIGTAAKFVGRVWWSADTPELVRCGLWSVPFGLFKLLAYNKVRRGCGLDRCKLLYTGAAPLAAETIQYLRSLDMPLLEVFGMSESTGAIAVCGPTDGARPLGACGRALPNGELTIAHEDGEILWRGANNMLGYKDEPAATLLTLSKDGQLHTGDLGRIDEEGYLYITGRKKDIIITAGAENVAPIPIEQTLMSLLGRNVGHVVLIGDQRKYLTVLIAPAEGGATAATTTTVPPSAVDVEGAIKEYNSAHAKSRAQRVQKAHVLEKPFDVSTGELTPTMKVKRSYVVKKFAAEIDSMYGEGAAPLVGYSSWNIGKLDSAIA